MSQFWVDGQSVHLETECHNSKMSQQTVVGWTNSVGRNVMWSVCGWTDRRCTVVMETGNCPWGKIPVCNTGFQLNFSSKLVILDNISNLTSQELFLYISVVAVIVL
jgi:hypothetical protein